jgi:hypothetical protein
MSDGGHHHVGDMGGPQGGFDPPSHHHHHHHFEDPLNHQIEDPLNPIFPPNVSRRGGRRHPRRTSGPALVVLWIVRLALLALFVFVAVEVFHGFASTGPPQP